MKNFENLTSGKKESGINRVIGVDAETEEGVLKYFKSKFESLDRIDEYCEKLPLEAVETIEEMNIFLKEFLSNYGLEAIYFPPEKIMQIHYEKLPQEARDAISAGGGGPEADVVGFYSSLGQKIIIYREWKRHGKLPFLKTLVHESMHLNSFQSVQKNKNGSANGIKLKSEDSGEEILLTARRIGLNIPSKDGSFQNFHYLDEAVIEELTIRFSEKFFNRIPALEEDLKTKDAYRKRFPEDSKDISYVRIVEDGEGFEFSRVNNSYSHEREQLKVIIEKIKDTYPNKFQNEEEVFEVFVQAVIQGRLLPLARLVEGTYGKGAFRNIAKSSGQKTER